jgi:predicted amidohydrolase YtcJ
VLDHIGRLVTRKHGEGDRVEVIDNRKFDTRSEHRTRPDNLRDHEVLAVDHTGHAGLANGDVVLLLEVLHDRDAPVGGTVTTLHGEGNVVGSNLGQLLDLECLAASVGVLVPVC